MIAVFILLTASFASAVFLIDTSSASEVRAFEGNVVPVRSRFKNIKDNVSVHSTTIFYDAFDTNTLLNTAIFETWDTATHGYDTPLSVEYETQHVSVGFDGLCYRYSILSCTIPPLPPDADIYRIEINILDSPWPGVSNLWFGYALRGNGYIMTGDPVTGYVVNIADGTGGRRIHFYRGDSGGYSKPPESQYNCNFSPLSIKRISVEIDREGKHGITCTFDTGALFEKTLSYIDTYTQSILTTQPTKLQLRGTASANTYNREGCIRTDTWLVEAIYSAKAGLRGHGNKHMPHRDRFQR